MKPARRRSHRRIFVAALLLATFVSGQMIVPTSHTPGMLAVPPEIHEVLASEKDGQPTSPDEVPAVPTEPESTTLSILAVVPTFAATVTGVATQSVPVAVETQVSDESPTSAELQPTPTPGLDPLRFVFPTPGPEPVSAWRPPLYPTPWEPTPHDHFYFARPIAADEVNWPLPDYRYGGVFFKDYVHTGVDIPVPTGTPVLAAGPGRVTWTGYGLLWGNDDQDDPYGLAVVIKHDFGYQGDRLFTIYAHLSRIDVVKGQQVNTGDVLGLSGATGNVTGPHLHFEVRLGKSNFHLSRNPELWISPPQGWGVVAARVMNGHGSLLRRHPVRLRNMDTGQTWVVDTYGEGSANSDPYYRENMVIGDLPGGNYVFWIEFEGKTFMQQLEVKPGMVSYFTFHGEKGFSIEPPAQPNIDFQAPTELPETGP